MKSDRRGKGASGVEVTRISESGIEMVLDDRKVLLKYQDFPWFKGQSDQHIMHVLRPHPGHLRWPDLDVDLEEASLFEPEKFPLIFRSSAGGGMDAASRGRKKTR